MRRMTAGVGAACLLAAAAAGAAPPPSYLATIGGPPKLPAGAPGTISVAAQGRYGSYGPGTILPVVVRNNSKRPVGGIHISGTALDGKGRVLAPGQDDGIQPAVIPPGGLAIGFVRFGGTNPPAGTRFKLFVTDTPLDANVGFSKQVDVPITALRYARGHVVGVGTNSTRKKVTRPIVAMAACFSRSGKLVTFAKAFGSKTSVPVGQKVPFDVDFARKGPAPACAHVVASMTGYSEL